MMNKWPFISVTLVLAISCSKGPGSSAKSNEAGEDTEPVNQAALMQGYRATGFEGARVEFQKIEQAGQATFIMVGMPGACSNCTREPLIRKSLTEEVELLDMEKLIAGDTAAYAIIQGNLEQQGLYSSYYKSLTVDYLNPEHIKILKKELLQASQDYGLPFTEETQAALDNAIKGAEATEAFNGFMADNGKAEPAPFVTEEHLGELGIGIVEHYVAGFNSEEALYNRAAIPLSQDWALLKKWLTDRNLRGPSRRVFGMKKDGTFNPSKLKTLKSLMEKKLAKGVRSSDILQSAISGIEGVINGTTQPVEGFPYLRLGFPFVLGYVGKDVTFSLPVSGTTYQVTRGWVQHTKNVFDGNSDTDFQRGHLDTFLIALGKLISHAGQQAVQSDSEQGIGEQTTADSTQGQTQAPIQDQNEFQPQAEESQIDAGPPQGS